MLKNSTIAAISTALSPSGVSIVRISGEHAYDVIRKIFKTKKGNDIFGEDIESHKAVHGYIFDGNRMIDEVLVLPMKAPCTYTGEDTVEIDCHGGVLVTKTVLDTVIKYGASLADPGEFSKRAFLNGKMDLSQAEAVIDLINSKNYFAMDHSLKNISGKTKVRIQTLANEILHEIAFIESAIDDPEHYSLDTYDSTLEEYVDKWQDELNALLKNSNNGRILRDGIKTAIVGKPNVGKSSFLNAILQQDRAIVTDIAGTTRDVLTESYHYDGISFEFMDTAGIRSTDDVVEKIGIDKSISSMEEADLVLFLLDGSLDFTQEDDQIYSMVQDKSCFFLLNKVDLDLKISKEDVISHFKLNDSSVFEISAKNQEGIHAVLDEVKKIFLDGLLQSSNEDTYITNARQKECLLSAKNSLNLVLDSIHAGLSEDFFSIDLYNAYESLGSLTGLVSNEDLVNEIFSKFCMGK